MFNQGEIVLVPVPFTDLSSSRRRPVIVLSNDAYNANTADVVVVAMTSNLTSTAYSFIIDAADLDSGTLNKPSRVRVDKIYPLSQQTIIRRFAKVNAATMDRIRQILTDLCRP
jgi:mRNA interferase MazF